MNKKIWGRFRPHPALTIAAIILMLLTARLSVWQFSRAEQKAALEQTAQNGLAATAVEVKQHDNLQPFHRAFAVGDYLPDLQIRIDNRVHNKIAGIHVITPLQLQDGSVVAVNRGWLAKTATIPPPPVGLITVQGILLKDQSDAFTLSSQTEQGDLWQNLDLSKYATTINLPLLTLALLSQDSGSALTLIKPRVNFKSQKSLIYAWQWLTFCFLTFVFYIVLGTRKHEKT